MTREYATGVAFAIFLSIGCKNCRGISLVARCTAAPSFRNCRKNYPCTPPETPQTYESVTSSPSSAGGLSLQVDLKNHLKWILIEKTDG